MPLADDIRAAAARAAAELEAAHDYYADTINVWSIVSARIASGDTYTFPNPATGTVTTHVELAVNSQRYIEVFLAESTLQQFLAIFESFLSDVLTLWLTAYPRSLTAKQVTLGEAIDAGDVPTLLARVVEHEVVTVTYKSPRVVFEYLCQRTGVGMPADADLDRLAEAKATRDVLVHNRGEADPEYRRKAGRLARFAAGERIEVPEPYHRTVWELLLRLTADTAAATSANAT